MRTSYRKIGSIAAVMLLTLSLFATAAAGIAVDTETTDTASTSELTSKQAMAYSGNVGLVKHLNISATSQSPAVEFIQTEGENTQVLRVTNDSSLMTQTASVSGTYYFEIELPHDFAAFDGLRKQPGENVTMRAHMINDETATNPATKNMTFYLDEGGTVTFTRAETGHTTAVSTSSGGVLSMGVLGGGNTTTSTPPAAKVERVVDVTGQNQTQITVFMATNDSQAAIKETATALEGTSHASYIAYAEIEGEPVPVFRKGQAKPSWLDTTNETYVAVSADGEEAVFHNVGSKVPAGADSVDVQLLANEKIGGERFAGMLQNYGASWWTAWSKSFNAVTFGIPNKLQTS